MVFENRGFHIWGILLLLPIHFWRWNKIFVETLKLISAYFWKPPPRTPWYTCIVFRVYNQHNLYLNLYIEWFQVCKSQVLKSRPVVWCRYTVRIYPTSHCLLTVFLKLYGTLHVFRMTCFILFCADFGLYRFIHDYTVYQ